MLAMKIKRLWPHVVFPFPFWSVSFYSSLGWPSPCLADFFILKLLVRGSYKFILFVKCWMCFVSGIRFKLWDNNWLSFLHILQWIIRYSIIILLYIDRSKTLFAGLVSNTHKISNACYRTALLSLCFCCCCFGTKDWTHNLPLAWQVLK